MKKSFLVGLMIMALVVLGTATINKTAETIPVDPLHISAYK
ncbi:hypothetical protein [Tumebacillus amylolyticus]|nr:hypothetical protein [Tumebacillus amylolyticus]